MQRMGLCNRLRPEKAEEYKRLHAAAWPGDGGYIWVPTATPSGGQASGSTGALHVYQRTTNGAGVPGLSLVGVTPLETAP